MPTSPEVGYSFDAPSDVVQWVEFRVTAPEVASVILLQNRFMTLA